MQPIFDNVEYIFSNAQETKGMRFGLPGLGKNGKDCDEERFKDQEIAGHVTLCRGERSALAALGAMIL